MRDVLVIASFFGMVFAPCFVALHAMAGEGPELGYDVTMRLALLKLLDTYEKIVESLKV